MPIRNTMEPRQISVSKATGTSGKNSGKSLIIFALLILFLIAVAGFAWSYNGYVQTRKELALLSDPNAKEEVSKKETEQLVESLKKLVVLPEDETPTVATITDAAAMAKEQPFYKDAHNGDKLLVYMQARKAYIYDPNRNILVNIGPIYIDDQAQAPSTSTPEAKMLNVEVRNGSNTPGKGTLLAIELKKDPNITVLSASNADNKDYQGILIVDLSGGAKAGEISALADSLEAKVVSVVPSGERASSAEVLVIAGN
ncbi:LytR C-terminal domain-containing protein [Patescibacteria group bacterium]|nr:LytR C-terminal domain-containing protein [Patescibacteria group bacterium]MBU1613253.1 LytR C-terminal domain-containing protein [Patescibacteria group bacterium]